MLFWFFEASQYGPHSRHIKRVRGDVLASNTSLSKVLFVNLKLFFETGYIRNINLDGPVSECFHKFIVEQLAIFRFVGVPDDDFVDVRLWKLLGLDLMLLGRTEQVV